MLLKVFSRISFIMLVLLLAGDRLIPFVDAAQRFVMNTITTSYIIIIILVVGGRRRRKMTMRRSSLIL